MNAIYVSDDLPPTPSYRRRAFAWVGGDPAGDGRLGTLTLKLWKAKAGPPESDRYAVVEEPGIGGRVFLLLNETDATQEDVYRLAIGPRGASCTCRAGLVHRYQCKHEASLAALIAGGHLPGPPPTKCEAAPAADDDEEAFLRRNPHLRAPAGIPF